jgi:hypothetical protein
MRNERKRKRSFLARFMVFMMIINLLSGVNPSVVRAEETIDLQPFGNNGKEVEHNGITLKETASNYSNGEFDVDLLIKSNGKTTTTQDKMDVVLVIDRSGSMSENGKMQNTKTAAKNFVKALLKNENVRVGLVSFAGKHRITNGRGPMLDYLPISKNEQLLTNEIDGYKPYDGTFGMSRNGTFTQAGLKKANELFTDAGRKKAIILITDGEPTYAYKTEPIFNGIIDFDDVKDNSTIKYTHQVWSIGTDKDGMRDPNKKNRKLGNVEDKYTTGSGKNKKEWTYKPYYVELITNYTDYVGDGSNLAEDVRVATLSEAGRLKKSGVDIFSIGIGVNDTGRGVLRDIASPNKYYDSNMSANNLNNVLSGLEHVFKEYGIDGGTLKIAMNKQLSLISESVVIEGKNTSENATEGDKQELIKRVANIQSNLDKSKGEIVLNKLTLGKDEELHIKFRAKLAENWMDGVPYSINENAELTPKNNSGKINFNIPTVKDIKTVNLVINKNWIGNKVPTGVNFLNFTIKANDKDFNGNIVRVTEDSSGNWTGKRDNLPRYKEGEAIRYTVEEAEGNNYQLKGKIESKTDSNNGKVTFTATNQNTEKVNITVTKKWGVDVPLSEQQSVTVGVFKNDGSKTAPVKEIELKDGNWTGKFVDLPYVEGGYQVKETKINGVAVNEDLKKLYKVEVKNGDNITATRDNVEITNDFNIDEVTTGKIKVVKRWTVEPKDITVSLFTKEETPAGSVWKQVKKHVKTDGQSRIQTIEFDEVPTDVEYEILETAIGDEELSEDAIQSILNDESDYPVKYKIGKYEVAVHGIRDNVFFIKNTNEDLLTEIKVTKRWTEVADNYKKPVKIQLYKEISESKLKAEGDPVELDNHYGWSWTFTNLDKKSGDQDIKYYVAEVGIGDQTKEINNLEQISDENGYMIGRYNVTITGNGTNNVVITNDVALIDVTAVKNWIGATPRQAVEFTLYRKQGESLVSTGKKVTLNSTDENTVATFTELPRLDEGKPVVYYVYETKIGTTPITLNPTTEEKMNYSVDVSGGKYSVEITDNGTNGDKKVKISNTFIPNPVGPVIPGVDTPVIPGGTPVIPPVVPTPNPSTPVVDVPDDSTPQGPSSPGNNSGEDGNTNGDEDDGDNGFEEIDEDDIPQDGNIDNADDADDADDNNEEETTDIADNKAPKGTPKLPKTGGETGDFLSIIGLGLIGLGLVIRRRR